MEDHMATRAPLPARCGEGARKAHTPDTHTRPNTPHAQATPFAVSCAEAARSLLSAEAACGL